MAAGTLAKQQWPTHQEATSADNKLYVGTTALDEMMTRIERDLVDLEPDASLHLGAPRPTLAEVGVLAGLQERIREEREVLDNYLQKLRTIIHVAARESVA
jgi:hypothetical protein